MAHPRCCSPTSIRSWAVRSRRVSPLPCLTIQWVTGATQTKVHGIPVLLQTSVGLCLNAFQAPQGPAVVVQAQQRALGI